MMGVLRSLIGVALGCLGIMLIGVVLLGAPFLLGGTLGAWGVPIFIAMVIGGPFALWSGLRLLARPRRR